MRAIDDVPEVHILDIRDHDADGVHHAAPQVLRHHIWAIAEFFGSAEHARLGVRLDKVAVLQRK